MVTDKVVDVDVALDVIKDGDVIAVSGFNMAITPLSTCSLGFTIGIGRRAST
ncbi:hypothetical protein [Vulcanisaeta distributa]|uniref:hypothetical protein n=1 Tax=Vulcanisaeta distributa TaxID=164451 RepID=UPI000A7C40F6|nr:hypothetical protein [Vulcanisaeta distributa]